jgi:hypothetical protein
LLAMTGRMNAKKVESGIFFDTSERLLYAIYLAFEVPDYESSHGVDFIRERQK